ncbi:ABC transporter [Paenibacillus swuensis]|uniref:ABC transporter n=1 Tax=Paenibacillus swuensis TaxID=1178515 RepID=A0A172TDN1_9BACL|nr:ABC transporter permease [Paenibacillus swuensis]ANE45130.1 ABC transporter [Paenibacillus swuensis]
MGEAIKAFMKRPTTKIGIITALMFQVIFSLIWMTGYNGVTDNTKNLRIAIVNEDTQMGSKVQEQLEKNLPFHVEKSSSIEAAREQLNNREIQMVVHIPADFSAKVAGPGQPGELKYYLNESNPATIKSIMTGVSAQITATVNKQAIEAGAAGILTQAKMPGEQVSAISGGLSERVISNVQTDNKVEGMNNQMVPMMMVLASYVGAMIMGMNMEQSSMALSGQVGKWRRFGARTIINAVSALVVALVGSSLVLALGGQSEQGFLTMWLFQSLFVMVFMFVSQLFLLLFGMAGMLFNIIMLSAQLVTSGAMVPRELLSDFYFSLSSYLPATYAVEGNMNILFGGPSVGEASLALVIIGLVAIVLGAGVTAVRRAPQPQRQPGSDISPGLA